MFSKCTRLFLLFTSITSLFILASPIASAATNSTKGRCIETIYYLHGKQPATSKCLKQETFSSSLSTIPYTNTTGCSSGLTEIDSTDNGNVCFSGTGYLGLYLTHVYRVSFVNNNGGWVRYYNSGTGANYYFSNNQSITYGYPFDGNALVTQICIYDYWGGGC
jgi:hypothetical protein